MHRRPTEHGIALGAQLRPPFFATPKENTVTGTYAPALFSGLPQYSLKNDACCHQKATAAESTVRVSTPAVKERNMPPDNYASGGILSREPFAGMTGYEDLSMANHFSLLLVSSSEDLARAMTTTLADSGYNPAYTLVDSPMELTAALAEEPWDIVAVEAYLPGLPWEDVLALTKATRESMPVVLIVEETDPELARGAIAAGVEDIIYADDWRMGAVFARILRESVRRKELSRLWDRLRMEEEKYRGMIDNSLLGLFQSRPWGEIISANPSCAAIFGFSSPDQLIQHSRRSQQTFLFSQQERERFLAMLHESGYVSGFEVEALRPDGSTVWVSINARPIRGEQGEIAAIEGTVEDIGNRKAIEAMIIRAKQEWEKTFDNVPDIICIIDRDMQIRRNNRPLSDKLGVHPRDLVGKAVQDIFGLDTVPVEMVRRMRTPEPGDYLSEEMHLPALGGSFLVSLSPFFTDGDESTAPDGTVLVAHDISRRVQLESKLRQAQKMEAIGTLAGGIAHDFNNILGVMMGYSELSLEEASADSPLRRRLTEVISAGQRARDLIHQILTFSRQEELELQPLNLFTVVKEACKLIRASTPANIDIRLNLDEQESTVLANLSQMHQVLMNLCANAAHAMKEHGGTLTITLAKTEISSETQGFAGIEYGQYLQLTVTDTGHGISDDIVDNIFDPFFTTKKTDEGTGMGLALVHGIVTGHGGTISVQSTAGEGSTFVILLPAADKGTRSADNASSLPIGNTLSQAAPASDGEYGTILVIDDEGPLAAVVGEMVQSMGYTPHVFTDSGEALQHFLESPESIDLVITDQTMPGLTGAELSGIFLRHRPDLPVILCTGFSEQFSADDAKQMGIKEYLHKPVSMSELERAVREAVSA